MSVSSPFDSSPVKAVVFDLDGLMFNTEDVFNLSGRELLQRRGMEMTSAILSQMIGRRAPEAFAIMCEMTGLTEPVDALLAESRVVFYDLLPHHLAPMPGLFELLELIEAQRLPKAVATSSSRDYLEDILGRYDLLKRFNTTLTAEDVTHGKPHPEIYLKAAERLGIEPHEMLVLEDSEAGTHSAAKAGARIISVPNDHSRTHDFSPATYVASALHDPYLLRLVRGEQ